MFYQLRDFVTKQFHNLYAKCPDDKSVHRRHLPNPEFFLYNINGSGKIVDTLNERAFICVKGKPWEAGSTWREVLYVEPQSEARLGVSWHDLR